MNQPHQPVLLNQVIELLSPKEGQSYLDLTAGYGGHAEAILERTKNPEAAVLVDRDQTAIDSLSTKFKDSRVIQQDFAAAAEDLAGHQQFDLVLADLGVSSIQFDTPERGFSLRFNGPLDMRMDPRQELTASDIVNRFSETELADLIYGYGEERASRRIAKSIVANRPILTTNHLAEVVAKNFRSYSRIHPATRTFQALRIAVNDELGQLERLLEVAANLLNEEGRIAIISFHSLEDRLVKRAFKSHPDLLNLTKKVISGKQFDTTNPRARSARLRAALKQKTRLVETL